MINLKITFRERIFLAACLALFLILAAFLIYDLTGRDSGSGERRVSRGDLVQYGTSRDVPLVKMTPRDGDIFEYSTAPPLIQFSWSRVPGVGSYLLEIADKADFSHMVKRVRSRVVNFSYRVDGRDGAASVRKLYWRVTAKKGSPDRVAKDGRAYSFTIIKKAATEPPKLVSPDDMKRISRFLAARDQLIFSWERTEENLKRKILFSKTSDFDTTYREVTADQNYWIMNKPFPEGRYYWRVSLYDESGTKKVFSEPRSVDFLDYEDLPLVSPEEESTFSTGGAGTRDIRFNWKKMDAPGDYILEVSPDRNFKSIRKAVTTPSSSAMVYNLDPGTFYWRVRVPGKSDDLFAMSNTRAFSVSHGGTPSESDYRSGVREIEMSDKNELSFSWKPINNADAYQVELHQVVKEKGRVMDKLVVSSQTDSTDYSVTDMKLLDVGKFYWSINGVKKDAQGNAVPTGKKIRSDFNISLKELKSGKSKVKIISPDIQVVPYEKNK